MIILFDDKRFKYTYHENRNYELIVNSFLKNTLKALDYLYKNKLLVLSYKTDELKKHHQIDILNLLINETEEPIFICKGSKNQYNPNTNTISFYDTHGITFRKNYKKRYTTKNLGCNSPVSLLAHEIIHCYHELFDYQGYKKRKSNKSTKNQKTTPNGFDLSFSNKEEELTIRLTNQIAKKLGEDIRRNYGRNYYPVIDVLSTEKENSIT